MLIMNQSKDTVWNLDNIKSIQCRKTSESNESKGYSVVVMPLEFDDTHFIRTYIPTLGTYESEARAKEVLQDILFAYGMNQYEFCSNSKEWCAVRDIYIMPDK